MTIAKIEQEQQHAYRHARKRPPSKPPPITPANKQDNRSYDSCNTERHAGIVLVECNQRDKEPEKMELRDTVFLVKPKMEKHRNKAYIRKFKSGCI
jgi:hypothetical protein